MGPVEVQGLPFEAVRPGGDGPLEGFSLPAHSLPAPEHFGVAHAGDSAQLGTEESCRRHSRSVSAAFAAPALPAQAAGLPAGRATDPLSLKASYAGAQDVSQLPKLVRVRDIGYQGIRRKFSTRVDNLPLRSR